MPFGAGGAGADGAGAENRLFFGRSWAWSGIWSGLGLSWRFGAVLGVLRGVRGLSRRDKHPTPMRAGAINWACYPTPTREKKLGKGKKGVDKGDFAVIYL